MDFSVSDDHRAIRDGVTPRASAEIGYEVVQVIEAVDRSLAAGGEPVELEAVLAEVVT